jgi:WD40 repeat protein
VKPLVRSLLLFILLAHGLAACSLKHNIPTTPTSPPATPVPTSTPGPLADLLVLDIHLIAQSEQDCEPLKEPFHIEVRVWNRGEGAASPFTVQVNEVWQSVQSGLPAGRTVNLEFTVETEQVSVLVDSNSQIQESNENNNRVTRILNIPTPQSICTQTPPELIPTALAQTIFSGHTAEVLTVAFSPDGKLVASGSVDNTLRLWRVLQGDLLRTMRGHPFPVRILDFSPNGSLLATGSTDGKLRVWRVSDGSLLRTLEGHAGWINSLDFSLDGRLLASSGQDFTVRIWRVSDGHLMEIIDEGMAQVNSIAFAPNSQAIAWCEEDGTVRLRSLSGVWLQTLKVSSFAATSLVFSPDGDWLAVGYADGIIRIWQVSDGTQLQELHSHTQTVTSLSFSPDGNWLASGSKDNTLRLWRLTNNSFQDPPTLILIGHSAPVNSIAFSPSGDLIASGSDDGSVRLWQVPQQ